MSSERSVSTGSSSAPGSAAGGAGGGLPPTREEKRAMVNAIPAEQQVVLLKNALTTLTKAKKELEIKLDNASTETKTLQERLDLLKGRYDATVKELEETRKQGGGGGGSSSSTTTTTGGVGGVTATVGAAGAAFKNLIGGSKVLSPATLSPVAAAGLSKEDAIAVMEDNEKLHIQMFELRASLESRNSILQSEVEALKASLQTSLTKEKKVEEVHTEVEVKFKKQLHDNEVLRRRLAQSAEAIAFFQNKVVVKGGKGGEHPESAVGVSLQHLKADEDTQPKSLASSSSSSLFIDKPRESQDMIAQVRTALEGLFFAMTALVPACSEVIHTLFRGSRDTQERSRQLAAFLVGMKEHSQGLLVAAGAVATFSHREDRGHEQVSPAMAEDELSEFKNLTLKFLQTIQDWCAFLSDHAGLLLKAVYLSAAIPLDDAKQDAEALTPIVRSALLRILIACGNNNLLPTATNTTSGDDYDVKGSSTSTSAVAGSRGSLQEAVSGLVQLGEVLAELGQGAPNDKVRMALQHMRVKCLAVCDIITQAVTVHCPPTTTIPAATAATAHGKSQLKAAQDLDPAGTAGLEKQIQNLHLMLHASDKRVAAFQLQFHCCVAELDEKVTIADRLQTEVAELRLAAEDYDSERRSITESFEEQIKVLSDQLIEMAGHDSSMTSSAPPSQGGGMGGSFSFSGGGGGSAHHLH